MQGLLKPAWTVGSGGVIPLVNDVYIADTDTESIPLAGKLTNTTSVARPALTTGIVLLGNITTTAAISGIFGEAVALAGAMESEVTATGSILATPFMYGNMLSSVIATGELQNRAPIVSQIPLLIFEQGVASEVNLLEYATDPDGDVMTMTFIGHEDLPTAFSFDTQTGILSYDGSNQGVEENSSITWTNNRVIFDDRLDFGGGVLLSATELRASLRTSIPIAGSIISAFDARGFLGFPEDIFGVLTANPTFDGFLHAPIVLEGVAGGVASLAGTITDITQLAGGFSNSVQMTGMLYGGVVAVAGHFESITEFSGSLDTNVRFEGAILGEASGLGRLGPDYVLFGDMASEQALTAALFTLGKDAPWGSETEIPGEWVKEQPL